MIATSVYQSERLLACGVDSKTADMSYRVPLRQKNLGEFAWIVAILTITPFSEARDYIGEKKGPAWSLSALLEDVLPHTINKDAESNLILEYFDEQKSWCLRYAHSSTKIWKNDPIEACVQMVEWLHRKKMLK